jgi:hypothetical protein
MILPFKEEKVNDAFIRTFSEDTPENLLLWHRDREDRLIVSIYESDWLFQIDNELPININSDIFIPKGVYHRIIKGTGELHLKVIKFI